MKQFKNIVSLVHGIRDEAMLEDFLLGITTESEREELCRRLEIVDRLLAGEPQKKIAHDLKVGVATVTRGSKELSQGRFKVLRDE